MSRTTRSSHFGKGCNQGLSILAMPVRGTRESHAEVRDTTLLTMNEMAEKNYGNRITGQSLCDGRLVGS